MAGGKKKTIEKPKKANANGLPVRRTQTENLAMNLIVEKSEE